MPASLSLTTNTSYSHSFIENMKTQVPLLIITSLSIVIAFAWDGAIKAYIDYYTPEDLKKDNTPYIKLIYAIVITIIMIIIITVITRYFVPDE